MKFYYKLDEQSGATLVLFDGYWGDSYVGNDDEFDPEKGVKIALFRAMKKRLLHGKSSEFTKDMLKDYFDYFPNIVQQGKIKNWASWTGKYMAFMAYCRGKEETQMVTEMTVIDEYGILSLTIKDEEEAFFPEERFQLIHKVPVQLGI